MKSPKKQPATTATTSERGLPKGFENFEVVQVYTKATKGNDSVHNTTRKDPPKNSKTVCYWLGQCNFTSPSDVWIFSDSKSKKDASDLRGNVNGIYGYNHGQKDILWFLPPNGSSNPPSSFTKLGRWTFPVQKRDDSNFEPEQAGFLGVGTHVSKTEKLDVSGQWRLLYKRPGDPKTTMTIYVKTPFGGGEKLEIDVVEPTTTIDEVKNMVQSILKEKKPKRNIPKEEIRLNFKTKPLKNSNTLDGCGIQDKDVLDMEPTIVYVKDLSKNNKVHTFTVDLDQPIQTLKKQIETKVGTPIKQQRLFFKKNLLNDDKPTYRSLGIQHKDTLELHPMQIHVKTPQGKTVTLNVHPNDTIQDIKKQVEDKENIPVADQRLEFNGKELKNPKSSLNDNNICHGDTLNLQPMKINVRTSDGKKIIPIDNVQPTDTIGDIKKRVFKKEGIPIDEQRLAFHNKPLENDKHTLKDCGIVHNDTLDLEGMHIFVKENWTDKKFKLFVEPNDTIDSVKDKIQKQEGHDKKNQYLIFKGVLLDDKPTLKDYGIKHKNVLNLERMKIFIKDYKGKTFTLDVRPTDSIDDIKQQIQDREGHPKDEQCLFFHNDLLDNPMKTLQDHGIKHKDTLELKKKPMEVVTPKSPKGPEYTVGLSPWADPLSPVGYSPKKKINRDGVRAKSKDLLKNRYHTDFASEMEELGAMAKERIPLKKADEADMKKQVAVKPMK